VWEAIFLAKKILFKEILMREKGDKKHVSNHVSNDILNKKAATNFTL